MNCLFFIITFLSTECMGAVKKKNSLFPVAVTKKPQTTKHHSHINLHLPNLLPYFRKVTEKKKKVTTALFYSSFLNKKCNASFKKGDGFYKALVKEEKMLTTPFVLIQSSNSAEWHGRSKCWILTLFCGTDASYINERSRLICGKH